MILLVQILLWTAALVEASEWDDVIDIWLLKGGNINNCEIFDVPNAVEKLAVSSDYDESKPFVLFLHGTDRSANTTFVHTMIDALEVSGKAREFNLLAVDAPEPLNAQGFKLKPYLRVLARINFVGERIGAFLKEAIERGLTSPDRIHLVGYSVGAHLAGYAARVVNEKYGKIASITGLDPAGPGFGSDSSIIASYVTGTIHVAATDATTTHVLHTNAYGMGTSHYSGSADFVFNNGVIQPGCLTTQEKGHCSHGRALKYLAEAIKQPQSSQFVGRKCGNWFAFNTCFCDEQPTAEINFPPDPRVHGVFYLSTNSASPFGRQSAGSHCPFH